MCVGVRDGAGVRGCACVCVGVCGGWVTGMYVGVGVCSWVCAGVCGSGQVTVRRWFRPGGEVCM